MDPADTRTAYIFELMEKSERSEALTKIEALLVVQYAFAGSIVQALPQLEMDVENSPTEVGKKNGQLMLEVARELIDEFAKMVDREMEDAKRPLVKPASMSEVSSVVNESLRKAFEAK